MRLIPGVISTRYRKLVFLDSFTRYGWRRLIVSALFAVAYCASGSFVLFVSPEATSASTAEAFTSLRISVLDADSKQRIKAKFIRIDRDVTTPNSADAHIVTPSGKIAIPSGLYRLRIEADGYKSYEASHILVNGSSQVLYAYLHRSLAVIGKAVASSVPSTGPRKPTSDQPDLDRNLGTVPGVIVSPTTNSGAAQEVRLRGKSSGETRFQLDGVTLGVAGSPFDITTIAPDLISTATTDFAPSPSGLAGTLNLITLEPTAAFHAKASAAYDSYSDTVKLTETGAIGHLLTAVQVVDRYGTAPLTGRTYLDQSGLAYPHGGDYHRLGASMKLGYQPLETLNLKALVFYSDRSENYLDNQDVGRLPDGIGPGGVDTRRFAFVDVTAAAAIGVFFINASAYQAYQLQIANESNAFVALTPEPSNSMRRRAYNGLSTSIAAPLGKTTITARLERSSEKNLLTVAEPITGTASNNIATNLVGLEASRGLSVATSFDGQVSFITSDSLGDGLFGTYTLKDKMSALGLKATLSGGSLPPTISSARTLYAPGTANFECKGGSGYVLGPSDGPHRRNAFSADISAAETVTKFHLAAEAYTQQVSGENERLYVPAQGEPSTFFPPNYFDGLAAIFHQPTVCGSDVFDPNHVYVEQLVDDFRMAYRGYQLSSSFALTRTLDVDASYDVAVAKVVGADSRFLVPNSYVIVGSQLPDTPIASANLTVAQKPTSQRLGFSVAGVFTGGNNPNHFAPNVLVSTTMTRRVRDSLLELSVFNLANTNSNYFSTFSGGVPYTLRDGSRLYEPNVSFLPREVRLRYIYSFGAR